MNATASLLADTICRTVELGVTITDAAVAGVTIRVLRDVAEVRNTNAIDA